MAQFTDSQRPDGSCVLHAEGEIDVAVVEQLTARMRECLDRANSLDVDFADVTFIDSSGLGALVLASKEAAAEGKEFGLVNVRATALRLLQLSGLHDMLVKQDPPA